MRVSQKDRAVRFRALHEAGKAFVIANAWDGGSARILVSLGFDALATSSGASAATLGRLDGRVTRDEALAHVRVIVAATDCPVSADLEKGFGDAPADVAETIRLAAVAGVVGGSIEDATGDKDKRYRERAVCAGVSKPVNFMIGIRGKSFTVADLVAAGVQRISLATSLYRAAMSGLVNAAREVKERGTFSYVDEVLTSAEMSGYLKS